jgi:hypothetical protein
MRAFAAILIAVVVCAAAPAFADAQSHVNAAHKAERRGDWRRAVEEWKAAYAAEPNAEYLVGIGDAYARLGNNPEARKSYEAYLSDPLAVPASVQKVRTKLAQLDTAPSAPLALPGAGLTLPAASPPPLPAPSATAPGKTARADATLPLPGIDSATTPPATADKSAPLLPLPGVTLAKKEPEKVASATPVLPLPLPGVSAKTETGKKEPVPAIATKEPAKPAKPIVAVATPSAEKSPAPSAALAVMPAPRETQPASRGIQRTMAYVTAGVAIAALSGGAYAFTQASSAHSDLTGRVHSGTEAQRLLEDERRNKTLSFVGFAGGLVAAGIATALFAF